MTDQPVVVVLGAGMGGRGVVTALAGKAHLVVVDRDLEFAWKACEIATAAGGTADPVVVNLTDLGAVQGLCADLLKQHGRVDAVVHLVGGWRGSKTVDADSIAQWNDLLPGIMTSVQTTTVAFRDALLAAPHGRYVMVTSTAVAEPKQNVAAYASLKTAAAAWVSALGDSFNDTPARAVVMAVVALVDQATREANPDKNYARFTDTVVLGNAIADLMADASVANGAYLDLSAAGA